MMAARFLASVGAVGVRKATHLVDRLSVWGAVPPPSTLAVLAFRSAVLCAPLALVALMRFELNIATWQSIIAVMLLVVVAALLSLPCERLLREWTDRLTGGRVFKRRRALAAFAQTMSAVLSLDELARSITDLWWQALRLKYVALLLPATNGDFSLRAVSGAAPEGIEGWRISHHNAICEELVRTKLPLRLDHSGRRWGAEKLRPEDSAELRSLPVTTLIPVVSRGQLVGLLAIDERPSSEVVELLTMVATQTAVALENAQLYRNLRDAFIDLERAQRQLLALQQTVLSAQSTLHLDVVLAKVAEGIVQALDYDHAFIHLVDEAEGRLQAVASSGESAWLGQMEAICGAPLGDLLAEMDPAGATFIALRAQRLILAAGLSELLPAGAVNERLRRFEQEQPRAWVRLPLSQQDQVVGCITLVTRRPHIPAPERELLLSFAAQAAVSIVNARLYDDLQRAYQDLQTAQERLLQTERLRVLGEMAGGVAHDFNNILAGILARAQLAARYAQDDKLREHLKVIEQAAHDGATIIRRIQDLARIRTDRSFAPVNANELVEQVIEFTRPLWKDAKELEGISIAVTAHLMATAPLLGNGAELREVLTNILMNAVDALPQGGTIRIETSSDEKAVRIAVTDTGVGMTEEVRRRVFDPFFTTKGERGSGLGMSIALGIVHRHQGRIEVTSAPGQGTTVSIELPALTGPDRRPAEDSPARANGHCPVLLIDDDEWSRTALHLMLVELGYEVTAVASPREGIRRFSERPYPIVITDLGMPELSGWEVARAVRDLAPETHIVLVTGWASQVESEQLRNSGVSRVLAKPFALADVQAALQPDTTNGTH